MAQPLFISVNGTGVPDPWGPGFSGDIGRMLTNPWWSIAGQFWGPTAASPHHELSDRVVQSGDVVVVDIGGAMPSGYRSDCTRTYAIGRPPAEFSAYYKVLKDAQEAACAAVRPGVRAALPPKESQSGEPLGGPSSRVRVSSS